MRFSPAYVSILSAAALPAQYAWIQNPANGHTYALTTPMTWHQAEAEAMRVGGHLATVRNAGENAWLVQTFPVRSWIGLTDEVTEGLWRWTSGEAFVYAAWCPGEPNNLNDEDYDGSNRDDTWILGGAGWQVASPLSAPSARRHHTLTYDPIAQRVLLFGGFDTTYRGDLWRSSYAAAQVAFGTGCGGPALTLGPGLTPPVVGQMFTAPVTNVPSGTPVVWMSLGLRDDLVGPFMLPLPLDGFGLPGCWAYHDVAIGLMLPCASTGTSTAQFSMLVPSVASIAGTRVIAQAWVTEPAANAAGILTSNALRVVLGTQ
ncbi:MAG: hypothetical protein IPK26_13240 [Planctomycetes bacterium]|nr:hypothetical protein [Planctomycetota bacterium]